MAYRVPNTQDPYADFSNQDIHALVRRGRKLQAQAMREFLATPFVLLRDAIRGARFDREDGLDGSGEAPAKP